MSGQGRRHILSQSAHAVSAVLSMGEASITVNLGWVLPGPLSEFMRLSVMLPAKQVAIFDDFVGLVQGLQ